MQSRYTKEIYLELLRKKGEDLRSQGRYPKRSDFSEEEVAYIKSFLGPWPRALEAAGLKPKREGNSSLEKNREKRIRAKRKRNESQ